ncbi:MAG: hypothetical protein K2I48_05560, partial [Muribaculaceae bacterium]|nr:hypothetical protein [Muribaculaceae bacterium]
ATHPATPANPRRNKRGSAASASRLFEILGIIKHPENLENPPLILDPPLPPLAGMRFFELRS